MPELPEVQTITDELNKILPPRNIISLKELRPGTARDPESLLKFPFLIEKVVRRGKYIVFETNRNFSIIIHLRMTGKIIYEENLSQNRKHARSVFDYEKSGHIVFDDIRTFGKIDIISDKNTEEFFARIGAEPLSDEFNVSYLKDKLKRRKAPIKNVLLEQKTVAGLGNIYVCELLYRAGISPEKKADSLKTNELQKITEKTKEVLKEAVRENGTTISDYARVDEKKGNFQNFLRVYQKNFCPKNHKISKIKQAGRSTYFCPECQK
ncbi:MAG: 5-hydroxymethyluracil DNA glycosylase [Candidatus Cloacimonadota bacterium]|nr:MAG: 5-hydroxymethyluracil DNA glycosylase [Candidatus Cloacimonadota bacterium]